MSLSQLLDLTGRSFTPLPILQFFPLIDSGIPQRTSSALLSVLTTRLDELRNAHFDFHDLSLSHAPAALSMISFFWNSAVGNRLPDRRNWIKALEADSQNCFCLKLFLTLVSLKTMKKLTLFTQFSVNLRVLATSVLKMVFSTCRKFLSMIPNIPTFTLCLLPYAAWSLCHFTPTLLAPTLIADAPFIAFRVIVFWSGMYQYCKRMVKSCPGCALSNCTKRSSNGLVYSIPTDAPVRFLFVDVYATGADLNVEGNRHYLITACGMKSFAVGESLPE